MSLAAVDERLLLGGIPAKKSTFPNSSKAENSASGCVPTGSFIVKIVLEAVPKL